MRCREAVLATALFLAACTAGADTAATTSEPVSVPPQQFKVAGARPAPAPLAGTLFRPPGTGPLPVVILLHGCDGLGYGQHIWAERLAGWGYASIILDSFAARDVRNVCAPDQQEKVTRFDRAGDVLSAAMFLRGVPGIDASRIAVIGFSHGGASAFTTTQRAFQDAAPGLIRGAVDYYAACRDAPHHGTIPLLALAGEDDSWGDPARTCTAFGRELRPDQPFEVKTYPGVVHAFDNPSVTMRTSVGHLLGYNEAAARDSFARVHAFLTRYVAAPS